MKLSSSAWIVTCGWRVELLEPGRNCWRIERAQRAAIIVDADQYFRLARKAMLEARHQLMLIGWDFDTRIPLSRSSDDDAPTELGAFISWIARRRPELQVHILRWDFGTLKLLGRGSTVFRLGRWAASKNITFKLDGAHPPAASHHQKIVVIDDRLALCGGIDMTAERWDTRTHRDNDDGRRRPTTHRRYGPWHDASMAVDGPAAQALGELARERWRCAGGKPIARPPTSSSHPWPAELKPLFKEVDVAISRTRAAHGGLPAVREIEAIVCDQIRRARRFVYAENQYFASRAVAAAIMERIAEPEGPEFVIVNPMSGRGWLDDEAMSPARARLVEEIRKADRHGRFRIYSPVTEGREDIYVHSKIMIVDDQIIRVGSANLNNRSMGLDSECDLTIDTALAANAKAGKAISAMLHDLLGEHLGVEPARVKRTMDRKGSLIATVEALCGDGRSLVPLEIEQPSALEKKLADNEVLDPESGGDDFEPIARPGLLAGLHWRSRRRQAA